MSKLTKEEWKKRFDDSAWISYIGDLLEEYDGGKRKKVKLFRDIVEVGKKEALEGQSQALVKRVEEIVYKKLGDSGLGINLIEKIVDDVLEAIKDTTTN